MRSRRFTTISNRAIGLPALAIVTTISSVILGGCGRSDSAPQSPTMKNESPSSTTAEPGDSVNEFPDMSSYSNASNSAYEVIDTPRVQGFAFTTPDGLHCANNAYPTPEFEWVSCWGPRPDKGPGIWSVTAERGAPATVEQSTPEDVATPGSEPPPLLPSLTKITAQKGDSICGVGEDGTTACRVGDHGFVLTPTATTLF